MTERGSYSGPAYWDDYHHASASCAGTRRTGARIWLECFLGTLQEHRSQRILDLGCGSGADAIALARRGYETTGVDISPVALDLARQAQDAALPVEFVQHDVADPLPFADARYDAVVSNLTLHMFPASLAHAIVAEVARCLRPGGLFLFHVNSIEDIPFRIAQQQPAVRLGPGFYRLGKGQTMRFFSEDCCRELVSGWTLHRLEHVVSRRPNGAIQKCAWRCIAGKN